MCGVYNIPDAAASTFELTFMLLMLSTPSCKWFYDAHERCRMLVHGNAAEKVDAILSVTDSVFNSNATCQRLLPNAVVTVINMHVRCHSVARYYLPQKATAFTLRMMCMLLLLPTPPCQGFGTPTACRNVVMLSPMSSLNWRRC